MGIFDFLTSRNKRRNQQKESVKVAQFAEKLVRGYEWEQSVYNSFQDELLFVQHEKDLSTETYLSILDSKKVKYDHEKRYRSIEFRHQVKLPTEVLQHWTSFDVNIRVSFNKSDCAVIQSLDFIGYSSNSHAMMFFEFFQSFGHWTRTTGKKSESTGEMIEAMVSPDEKYQIFLFPPGGTGGLPGDSNRTVTIAFK